MVTNNSINNSTLVTTFLSSGTWNINPRTSVVQLFIFSGGSGGGSGRQGLSGSASGGSGGGGGGATSLMVPAT